jgi:hypothetical protein
MDNSVVGAEIKNGSPWTVRNEIKPSTKLTVVGQFVAVMKTIV